MTQLKIFISTFEQVQIKDTCLSKNGELMDSLMNVKEKPKEEPF